MDSRHIAADDDVLVVHVTAFNRLMWDNGRSPTRVIEHGAIAPRASYSGELERGLVVISNVASPGRRLGYDLFEEARKKIPLDLVRMETEEAGGLPAFAARYRFFFNPIRYASPGLAVIEAMMIGMPIVALATAGMVTVIKDGLNGFIDTDPDRLIAGMRRLLEDPHAATRMGEEAKRTACERFGIARFVADWNDALYVVTGSRKRSNEAALQA